MNFDPGPFRLFVFALTIHTQNDQLDAPKYHRQTVWIQYSFAAYHSFHLVAYCIANLGRSEIPFKKLCFVLVRASTVSSMGMPGS